MLKLEPGAYSIVAEPFLEDESILANCELAPNRCVSKMHHG